MKRACALRVSSHPVNMLNAIGSSRESNPSRRICNLRAVLLGHVAGISKTNQGQIQNVTRGTLGS